MEQQVPPNIGAIYQITHRLILKDQEYHLDVVELQMVLTLRPVVA
jgi:hypothetical protein